MPFFQNTTKVEIEQWCNTRSTDELKSLHKRIDSFIQRTNQKIASNDAEIAALKLEISNLHAQIKENEEYVKNQRYRNQQILDNLPGNGAERYLALQAVTPVNDMSFDLKNSLEQKEDALRRRQSNNNLLTIEVTACKGERSLIARIYAEKIEARDQQNELLKLNGCHS